MPDRLGVPRQVMLEPPQARPALQIEAVDEAGLTAALTAAASRGFDLSRETPLRAHLFELRDEAGQDQQVLLLLLHHIAGDGWSLGPLWRDLAALYRARHDGIAAALSPLPVQYADYTLVAARGAGRGERPGQRHRAAALVLEDGARRPAGADRAAHRPAEAFGVEPPRRHRAA